MARPLLFGIVAGEASGDLLAAALIPALRDLYPGAQFVGIAGPQMLALGVETLAPMERLAVMGLVEVVGRLGELLRLRARLMQELTTRRIDAFIGIDAPDFNLALERHFKERGIPTFHYVSPSVWAWRPGRVKTVRRACDRVLCLLPFEPAFYARHGVDAVFVGHPLADTLPLHSARLPAREHLHLDPDRPVLALLPGSRRGEVARIGPVLHAALLEFWQRHPHWQVAIAAINEERRVQIETIFADVRDRVHVYDASLGAGVGRYVMQAADQVWLASGTASLEAMLIGRPMLVLYRFHWLTYWMARLLVKISIYSLPNLLAGTTLVPELIQGEARPEKVLEMSERISAQGDELASRFQVLHRQLRCDASRRAAEAIREVIDARR